MLSVHQAHGCRSGLCGMRDVIKDVRDLGEGAAIRLEPADLLEFAQKIQHGRDGGPMLPGLDQVAAVVPARLLLEEPVECVVQPFATLAVELN